MSSANGNKLCSECRTIDNSKSHNYLFAAELCRCSLKPNQVISCRCNHRHNQIFLREKTSHVSVGVSKLVVLNSYTKRQNIQQLHCWLPDSIYAVYGNSRKQAYSLQRYIGDNFGINSHNVCSWMTQIWIMGIVCHQLCTSQRPNKILNISGIFWSKRPVLA